MSKKSKRNKNKALKSKLIGNKSNQVMVQCSTHVDRDAVRREVIDGVEHIIVSSYTMPDDIVMNGGLYPAQEIADSFKSLERTLAPVEHPQDSDGNFISASDPTAIHNFHAGAFNTNVSQIDGRLHIEKFINVQEALKSERGKRLLERIEELETNENPRPIHTSTGIFLIPLELDSPQTNAKGDEYTWVASEMNFDHDAILLDNVGAAQPKDGVGMAVNSEGKQIDIRLFTLNESVGNIGENELSFSEIRDLIQTELSKENTQGVWIRDVFQNEIIYELSDSEVLYSIQYVLNRANSTVSLTSAPVVVERTITYTVITNAKGDEMKDMILNALKAAKIETDGLDDKALLEAYTKLSANDGGSEGSPGTDEIIDNADKKAIDDLSTELKELKDSLQSNKDEEHKKLAEIVGNSDNFPGLDEAEALKINADTLKSMAAHCGGSFGVPLANSQGLDAARASVPEFPPE